jgi:uncharacterized repeat protein (TIGR03803 family)
MCKFIGLKGACAALVLLAATAITLPAQTFTTLGSFNVTNGANPYSTLVQATNGNLYGTTVFGGADNAGTVFEITPGGAMKTLYSFCSQSGCPDGENPTGGLIQATDGNFYGLAGGGGVNGAGTVFKITPSGTLTTLYNFCPQGDCAGGEYPGGTLIQATDGNLYGTTVYGGTDDVGVVFKITTSGTFTTLHSFRDSPDGANPVAGLVQATNGNFYGMTEWGGVNGLGTVFEITSAGTLTTLYSFCSVSGCTDGNNPNSGLMQATDGNLYGVTVGGGDYGWNAGTLFRMTLSGKLTKLYNFCSLSNCADGNSPYITLIQATDGNLYGATAIGGQGDCGAYPGCGTIFKSTLSGTLTTLFTFDRADGGHPNMGLVQDTNGNFYGTTVNGGADSTCSWNGMGCGTVYSLSMGLGPFVETQPTFGPVGIPVKILGTNLTGATSVTFNGTAAVFKVASPSLVMAIVPTGATTGTVQVVTPSGTLSSNVPFRVR